MEVRKTALVLVAGILAGCNSGSSPAPAPAGSQDISKLTPQQQIEHIQNDKTIPDQFKPTAINSIKAKYGLK